VGGVYRELGGYLGHVGDDPACRIHGVAVIGGLELGRGVSELGGNGGCFCGHGVPRFTGLGGLVGVGAGELGDDVGERGVRGDGGCGTAEGSASAVRAAIPLRVFLYAEEAALFERLTCDALQTGYYPAFLRFLPVDQKAEAQRLFAELYARRTELYRRSCNLTIDTTGLNCAAVTEKIAAIC